MAKTKHINFKISESDFKKLEAMRGDRTIAQLMRDLIKSAVEKEQQEVNSFIELLRKIENTDTTKITENVNEIIKMIKILNNNIVNTYMKLERVEIMLEELANVLIIRSDYREKYFERVKQRVEEKQQ